MSASCSILLVTDWFDHRMHHGVARFAREQGWALSLEAAYSRNLPWGWRGDGCVALIFNEETARFVRSLEVPTVDMASAWSKWPLPRVCDDDEAAGRMAARFFLERGFRQLAFCTPSHNASSKARDDGFTQEAVSGGATVRHLLLERMAEADWSRFQRLLEARLPTLTSPTGVFCVDDRVAALVCEVARRQGMEVPGRLSILGMGDLENACECALVPLSSIQLDPERHGYEAAAMLAQVLAGKWGPWPVSLPPIRRFAPLGVVERASTRGVAVHAPALARVVERLFADPTRPWSMVEMADWAGVGRQKLYDLFAEEFDCTPGVFLERLRLRQACRMLENPKIKLQAVARDAGFGNPLRLHRAFGRQFAMSPGQWRKLQAAGRAPRLAGHP